MAMNTVLTNIKRVEFNAANPEHRIIAEKFFETYKWEGPIRFTLDEDRWNNIPLMIQHKLMAYYFKQDVEMNKIKANETVTN